MNKAETIENSYGFRELKNKPTEEELNTYYSSIYYQQTKGSYQKEYSFDEINYINSKLEQKYLLVSHLLIGTDKKLSFLDIGCGEGWSLSFFKNKGFNVKGIEYSKYACETFNNNVVEDIEVGNAYKVLFDMEKNKIQFDVILIQNVLEHVLDPLQLLKCAKMLLSDNGVVILQVPNDFSTLQKYLLKQLHIDKEFWVTYPDHISYFNKEGLKNLCVEAGLSMIKILSDFPIDFNLMNIDTNYVMDKSKGKNCHISRVLIENMLNDISPERTNIIYEQLGEMGLGREIIGLFKKSND